MKDYVAMAVEGPKGTFGVLSRRISRRFRRGLMRRGRAEKAELEEAQRRALVEQIPAATYVLEVGNPSSIVYCSPQIEAMLGYPRETYERDPRHWVKVLHPDDRERVVVEDARVGSTGEPFDVEYRCVASDGRTVWVHDKASVVPDEKGRPRYREGIMIDVTDRKAIAEQLEHRAFHDPLTDLANRNRFMDRLGHALSALSRRGGAVAVLFMDLDDFKPVNDSLGHEVGDRLLVAAANRVRSCVRPEDTVARFGGDEFAVLLVAVGATEAARVAERITGELRAPFVLEGHRISIGASVGIALGFSSSDQPSDLLRQADLALYEAKRSGKGHFEFFEEATEVPRARGPTPEKELRRAIERGEFTVHYQPKVLLRSGEVVGVEALVRWKHPERGLLRPGEFIPLAEETGLVVPLGRWVLREACAQAARWQERYPHLPLTVSVNISARQLRHPGLVEESAKILHESGLGPSKLVLEVPERVAMDAGELATLNELKDLGVRLEIDDFGTGNFSLPYLERLPADSLKVDFSSGRGTGQDPEREVIASAAVGLAHALGREVVAEGVETGEQLARLRELGFERAQGRYLAGSLPSEEVSALLATGMAS